MWLVQGYTGEYEDAKRWIVASFDSPRRAQTWATRAQDWANAKGVGTGPINYDIYHAYRWPADEGEPNPYDAGMVVDYTGVSYGVTKLTAPHNPKLPAKA